jgi:hypothetical protein
VQVRVPIFAQQVLGLVAHHEVATAGNAELDVHHRRDRAGQVLGALIDPDPAGDEPRIKPLEICDPGADFLLRPLRARDIMEGDFQRHLQHRSLHILGAF